ASEWAVEQSRYQEWRAALPPSHCAPADLPKPEAKDVIRGVYFDDAGRIWVERRAGRGFAFDVFNDLGRLLGSVDTPAHVDDVAPYIRADRLYLVTSDSLDVRYVRVFAIEK
ncbi:MAG TPA: hypothetical protein VK864_19435, partial [Longimicrobiales bacterium]|nr:hypothetical protein [Longimicrobiales bacterium]